MRKANYSIILLPIVKKKLGQPKKLRRKAPNEHTEPHGLRRKLAPQNAQGVEN